MNCCVKFVALLLLGAFVANSYTVISKEDHQSEIAQAEVSEQEPNLLPVKSSPECEQDDPVTFYEQAKLSSHYCTCSGDICKCCVDIKQEKLGLNDTLCVDVEYLKNDLGIKMAMTWGGRDIISEEVSARNPPPICAAIPIPKLEKVLRACVRLHNISISSTLFETCMSVKLEVAMVTVLNAEIGCLSLGHKDQHWMCGYHHEYHITGPRLPSCVNMCHKSTGLYDSQLFTTEGRKEEVKETFIKNGCHYLKQTSTSAKTKKGESKSTKSDLCIVGCVPDGYMD
ncbi:uncharacterized protein LOC142351197 [Convolutriloba macropyga]|uniref:uncharacterized protein LOC142351197 n=1 Tax=Convolutriloba macropyga TaxID=536237 RepID=UPI003F51B1F6